MIYRKSKRHLEFDSLEALELLSGAGVLSSPGVVPHRVAQVQQDTKTIAVDVTLNLSGTLRGTYRVESGGSSTHFTGQGRLTPIGKANLKGTISDDLSGTGGPLTLSVARRGTLLIAVSGQLPSGGFSYEITGGTKSFAGDSGVGTANLGIRPSNSAGTRGHFVLTL